MILHDGRIFLRRLQIKLCQDLGRNPMEQEMKKET